MWIFTYFVLSSKHYIIIQEDDNVLEKQTNLSTFLCLDSISHDRQFYSVQTLNLVEFGLLTNDLHSIEKIPWRTPTWVVLTSWCGLNLPRPPVSQGYLACKIVLFKIFRFQLHFYYATFFHEFQIKETAQLLPNSTALKQEATNGSRCKERKGKDEMIIEIQIMGIECFLSRVSHLKSIEHERASSKIFNAIIIIIIILDRWLARLMQADI